MSELTINVIGAGLAGSEAAWQIARRGVKVRLYRNETSKANTCTPHRSNLQN